MRIAVPVQHADEAAQLADAGADELYAGFMSAEWRSRYGAHDSISRRQGAANLSDPDGLKLLARKARAVSIPVYLTLNARYVPAQYEELIRLARFWEDSGGTGVILRDPGFMLRMKQEKLRLRVTASLLTVTVNADGVRFFRSLGADRIVFPRCMTCRETAQITAAVPDTEYESMIFGDGCPYIDGLCRGIHGESLFPDPDPGRTAETRYCFDTTGQAAHLCLGTVRHGPDPCAACALTALAHAGIQIGKMGGRGLPVEERLRRLRFMRQAMSLSCRDARAALYRDVFHHACDCYDPEVSE